METILEEPSIERVAEPGMHHLPAEHSLIQDIRNRDGRLCLVLISVSLAGFGGGHTIITLVKIQ